MTPTPPGGNRAAKGAGAMLLAAILLSIGIMARGGYVVGVGATPGGSGVGARAVGGDRAPRLHQPRISRRLQDEEDEDEGDEEDAEVPEDPVDPADPNDFDNEALVAEVVQEAEEAVAAAQGPPEGWTPEDLDPTEEEEAVLPPPGDEVGGPPEDWPPLDANTTAEVLGEILEMANETVANLTGEILGAPAEAMPPTEETPPIEPAPGDDIGDGMGGDVIDVAGEEGTVVIEVEEGATASPSTTASPSSAGTADPLAGGGDDEGGPDPTPAPVPVSWGKGPTRTAAPTPYPSYSDEEEKEDDWYGANEEPPTDDKAGWWGETWNDGPTKRPTARPTALYVAPEGEGLEDPLAEELEPDKKDFSDDEIFYHGLGGAVGDYLDGVQSPREIEQDKNVQVVTVALLGVFLVLLLITAHFVMQYPDGLCAGCCRLTLKCICCFFRTLCLPCRAICCKGSDQSQGRRSHAPMRGSRTPFPTDLELA